MIWFSCSKCGKALSRPEVSAGAYVFCECGQGMVVPWENSIDPPSTLPVDPPQILKLVPLEDEPARVAIPEQKETNSSKARKAEQGTAQRRAESCFNHQDRPGIRTCADCKENFCADCVVAFQSAALCGPCKNFRLRDFSKASTVCGKAVVGTVLAISCAPVVMCLIPLGEESFAMIVGLLALVAQVSATVLGALALRETERDPRLSGRSLAITTIVTGGLAQVVTVCFLVALAR